MNPPTREDLWTATSLWFEEALAHIRQHPEQWAELKACQEAGRDVRIVWHVPSHDISVEVTNENGSVSPIFRDYAISDATVVVPDTDRMQ